MDVHGPWGRGANVEYAEALKQTEKLIRAKAYRSAMMGGPQDVEDLVQEGRIVLERVLNDWDGQRSLHRMLGFYLDRRYRNIARARTCGARVPVVPIQYVDGSWHEEPITPGPLDAGGVTDYASGEPTPEEALLQLEDARQAKIARIRIRRRLTVLQAAIFDLWCAPPKALIDLAWDESGSQSVQKQHIALYLDIKVKAVEYAFCRIREACGQVLGILPARL